MGCVLLGVIGGLGVALLFTFVFLLVMARGRSKRGD